MPVRPFEGARPQLRDHVAREAFDVLHGEVMRQRAELQEREEVSEAEHAFVFGELVAHGRRGAADELAARDELVDRPLGARLTGLRFQHRGRRSEAEISRRPHHLGRHAQELVRERLDVRLRLRAGRGVGFSDVHGRHPAELIGGGGVAGPLRFLTIEIEEFLDRRDRTVGLQVGILAFRRRRPYDRFAAALRRNPNRRVRLLVWTRPRVDVRKIVVLPAPVKGARFGPCAHDQIVGFAEAFVRERRVHVPGMIFGADPAHEPRDEAAARNVVEDREFFGDHERVVHQRQRAAEHGDRSLRAPRERARDHARRRHQAVGVLVMFVNAEAVEAELVGIFEFVEIAVVERVAFDRIVVAVGQRHPRRVVRFRIG